MLGRTRKIAQTAVVATIAGMIAVAATAPADAASNGCADVAALPASKLKHCSVELQRAADDAGQAAQKADEQWVQAKQALASARSKYDRLADEATAAALLAERTRARAGAVAVQLARSGSTVDETTQVLLSGDGVDRKLYHLSRMNELTEDTHDVAAKAVTDSEQANTLQQQAAIASQDADVALLAAKQAYRAAKAEAKATRALVAKIQVRQGTASAVSAEHIDLPADASVAQRVVAFAEAQIGDPYVFGAAGPNSWDCSGLTMQAFASAGIDIGGHGATVQYTTAAARGLLVPYSQAQPGDLVFYGGGGDYFHVAIYVGGGNMIEAPYPGRPVRNAPVRSADLAPMVARFTAS